MMVSGQSKDVRYGLRAQRRRQHCGFSLVELMIGLALASVVLVSIFSVFINLSRSYTTQNVAAEVQQTARISLDYMVRDIRMAGLDPLGRAGAGIEEIAPDGRKIRFTADLCDIPIGNSGTCENPTPNGSVEDKLERVTYFYNAADRELLRCLYEPNTELPTDVHEDASCTTIVDGVIPNPDGSPLFEFFDDDSTGPKPVTDNAKRDEIRTVKINLTVEEPAGRDQAVHRSYSTQIRCRNIGL